MKPWLDIIGIGEDGYDGLSADAKSALQSAEIIIGGSRHHGLAPHLRAERIKWPSPFSAMADKILGYRGRKVALLVTGDPLWYSAGSRIARVADSGEIKFHPQISAFQHACARMGWSIPDVEKLTAHGRPASQIVPAFANGARLVVLTSGSDTALVVARLLTEKGFGRSHVRALGAMGGPRESSVEGTASEWSESGPKNDIPDFHTLCIECIASPLFKPLRRGPGLPDEAFESDGNITKREVRAITLAALSPARGELLWDIGLGSGSVSVEWMRAAPHAEAFGIERRSDRCDIARRNSENLGTPRLRIVHGTAPDALRGLPSPDAVFIGGGLDEKIVDVALAALKPFGRLVANGVTLESESLLASLHAKHGGRLVRIAVERAENIGSYRCWRRPMTVTQWALET
ncbi:MAG: precorrin-6y C5,15-methyltransferase (decarboxylating) subunit CbiE [Albidovulum sp.]|nr:precorrin-6y C5,15-methyltransferase (decarboxylating) subunit CbiE [Albidovulum sp.]